MFFQLSIPTVQKKLQPRTKQLYPLVLVISLSHGEQISAKVYNYL